MTQSRIPFGDLSLSATLANFQRLRGGKRLNQAIAAFGQAMAERDTNLNVPQITSSSKAVSLSAPVADIQLAGSNFLVPSQDSAPQAVASMVVFAGAGPTDIVTVYSRMPGAIANNIELTIATPGGVASAVDSGQTTATPKVLWTPKTGDVAGSIAALNTSSKLLWAVAGAGAPVIGAQAATKMSGGVGKGVRLYLGQSLVQDASVAGATFAGSAAGTHIRKWTSTLVDINVSHLDLAVGKAVPTGGAALVAVEGLVSVRLEWTRPLFEATYPLSVVA